LDRAKQLWEQKTTETDKKIQIRETQLKTKVSQQNSLASEIEKLKKMLQEVDEKIEEQNSKRQEILRDITGLKEEHKDVGQKLQQ